MYATTNKPYAHAHTRTHNHLHSIRYEAGDSDPKEWAAKQTYGKRGRYMNCSKVLYDALKTKIAPAIAHSTALHAAALSKLLSLHQRFIDVTTSNIDAAQLINDAKKMWTVPPEWANAQAEASWDVAVADFKAIETKDSFVANAQTCNTKISETCTYLEREW